MVNDSPVANYLLCSCFTHYINVMSQPHVITYPQPSDILMPEAKQVALKPPFLRKHIQV